MSDVIDPSVAQARRELRALLSRRDFVATTGGIVAGMAGLSLAACSSDTGTGTGGGGTGTPTGGIPAGLTGVTGSVALPAGSTLALTDLSISVLTQQVAVSAGGGFTVGLSPDGPALGLLLDAAGDGVLMALLDAGASSHPVSAHTTAVAMLFYAMDAYLLPAVATSQVAALIDADPAVPALADAVGQAVAADPHALANNAAPLGPAVITAMQAMFGTTTSSRRPAVVAAEMDPAPPLILVNPAAPQNGVEVNQDITTNSLLISNTLRRGCRVYVYETATVTGANSPSVPVSPAKLVAGPLDLDATENLGVFTALKDVVQSSSPYLPVNLPAIPLTLVDGTDRTLYEVIVLAASPQAVASQEAGFEPMDPFRTAIFSSDVAMWRDDLQTLLATCVMGQILLPILCFMGGFGALVGSALVVKDLVAQAKSFGTATFQSIIDNLGDGSLPGIRAALAKTVQDAVSSPTSAAFWKPEVQAVISDARKLTLQIESVPTFAEQLGRGLKMFSAIFEPIFAVGVVFDGIDLHYVIEDFANSALVSTWSAVLIRQVLTLAPQNPRIDAGEHVTFGVSNPANTPTGQFVYDWTSTSLFDVFSANGEVNVGNAITTAQRSVDLATTGADINPVTVQIVGYDTSSGVRVEIGRAGTVVSFLLPAEITPTGRIASIGDQVVFVVTVGGTLPNGALTYQWTLTGTGGSIGDSNVVTTTVPNITWTAATPGQSDALHVDVYSGTTLIAKADVSISVAGPPFIDFTVAGSVSGGPFNQNVQLPDGHFHFGPAYVGLRAPSPDAGLDGLYMAYDFATSNPNASPGVFIAVLLPSGANPVVGQVLSKWSDEGNANQFQFDISTNLSNPDDPNALIGAPVGTGTLTVNGISQQNNGEWIMQYTFQVLAESGGTISGTGAGKWGASGVEVTS